MSLPQRPPRVVLGLNAFGHDAAAVLLVDGEAVFAASEERFDRVRYSPAFPARAIDRALAFAGLAPDDVDVVAFPWARGMARLRKALHVARHLPESLAFLREPPDARLPSRRSYLAEMASLPRRLREVGLRARVVHVPHHDAHAASAALLLPDASGAVLTADGMGEWVTAAAFAVERGLPARRRAARYPHSAGKAYAAVTAWLGFEPEADEGKTMGLCAYGDPSSRGAAFGRTLLRPDPRRLLRVELTRFAYHLGSARRYGDAFLTQLGPARRPDEALRPGDADVALGIQEAIEGMALDAASRLLRETGAPALGLAGGLFLNCRLNGVLARACPVPVLPFPVAGDAGAAWGAAAWVHRRATGRPAAPPRSLRLGSPIGDDEAARALAGREARRLPLPALCEEVATRVARGALVGVARGRAEAGPRALGGRSVLARADDPATRDRLNDHKGRERWRPVAPVVRAEDVGRLFRPGLPSPHMILTLVAEPDAREGRLRGGVHADGTARVQTVTPEEEPFLHGVLTALASRGHVAVLNTSLNRRGEPIVDSAAEALVAAEAMRLDALVLEDLLTDLPTAGAARGPALNA